MLLKVALLFFYLTGSIQWIFAQEAGTVFKEMYQDAILDCRLQAEFATLLSDIYTNEAFPGTFSYRKGKKVISREVNLEIRGKFRRINCDFPPLMIKFKKKDLAKDGLSEHNDIKLVTHCLDDSWSSRKNIMKEYLAYKLFNILSDHSFRVQLIRITYEDTSGELSDIRYFGLLIEDSDELAERLDAVECEECLNPDILRMDLTDLAILSVFQYMIGNTDWSILMNRNVKLLSEKKSGNLFSVPYDFDFSGWVNAPYALPNKDLGQKKVTDRIYIGLKLNEELALQVRERFLVRKKELYNQVRHFKKLDSKSRKELIGYLDSFYAHLDNIDMRLANRALSW